MPWSARSGCPMCLRPAVRILLLMLATWQSAYGDTLRIASTGGATELMRRVGEAFARLEGAKVDVLPGYGSDGAIRALAAGAVDVAVSARPLQNEEAAAGLMAIPLARTPLVFVTSHHAPTGLRVIDLADLFAREAPVWPDGTRLRVILRTRGDTDTLLVGQAFPQMREALAMARQRPDVPVAATDQDNFDLALRIPGSLTSAGLAQIVAEKPNLRVVPLDGVTPTVESLGSRQYPHEKRFFLVRSADPAPAVERLAEFLRSPAGRGLLRENASLPFGF